MASSEKCGGWRYQVWKDKCEKSPSYPDGRCGFHSDYVENKAGPTASITREVCSKILSGSSIQDAVSDSRKVSRTSHGRWMKAASDLADRDEFGNDFVEYRSIIERVQLQDNRAPHRWVEQAANQVEFAAQLLHNPHPRDAAILEEYAACLRKQSEELKSQMK